MTRFSQDMRLVDMILPRGFISTGFRKFPPLNKALCKDLECSADCLFSEFFGAIAQCATAVASLPYLAATLPFLVGVLYVIQRFYLKTSRQLRLLE